MSTNVNLLDCLREPSDEQLQSLMQGVAADARARAAVANNALMHTLRRQVEEVRARYQLSSHRAVPTAA